MLPFAFLIFCFLFQHEPGYIEPNPSRPSFKYEMKPIIAPLALGSAIGDSLEILLAQGYAKLKEGKPNEAVRIFDMVTYRYPYDERAYFLRGSIFKDQNEFAKALNDFAEVIRINPHNHSAFFLSGLLEKEKGNFTGALENLNAAISLESNSYRYYEIKALICQDLANHECALLSFSHALRVCPPTEIPRITSLRAFSNLKNGNFREAISDYSFALKSIRNEKAFYNNRGLAKKKAGDLAGAVADFSKAINIDPSYLVAYNNRGLTMMLQNDYRHAILDFSNVIQKNKQDSVAYNNRGLARQNIGDWNGAYFDFSKVIDIITFKGSAYFNRGIVNFMLGNYDEADVDLTAVLNKEPNDEVARQFLKEIRVTAKENSDEWVLHFMNETSNPAVSTREKMEETPTSAGYIAFSLNNAGRLINSIEPKWLFREKFPAVFNLAGINEIQGVVYDRKTKDIIIVGKHNAKKQPVTLDDFVVALRAIFVRKEFPLVSIDFLGDNSTLQTTRFEGGIENSQFGADLLRADYQLKLVSMGLSSDDNMSLLDINCGESIVNPLRQNNEILSRFWFYPSIPYQVIRGDVAAFKGLKVNAFTEVLRAKINGELIDDVKDFQYPPGKGFVKM